MNKIRRYAIWMYMFSKRLFKKLSFIIILCVIMMMTPIMNSVLSQESKFLKIAICSEEASEISESAMNLLLEKESVIEYIRYESPEKAIDAVKKHKVDSAWVFEADLKTKISDFISGKNHGTFLRVVEREDSTLLQLAREMMFSAVFEEISYQLYKNYAYENFENISSVSEDEVRSIYEEMPRNEDIIEIKVLNSKNAAVTDEFLTGPVRGIMSVILVLAALAGAMYFLKTRHRESMTGFLFEERWHLHLHLVLLPLFLQELLSAFPFVFHHSQAES